MISLSSSMHLSCRTHRISRTGVLIVLLLLGLALSSCNEALPSNTPTANEGEPTAAVLPSETPIPTATYTQPPPLAILLAPQADAALVNELQDTLEAAITAAGLRWQVRQSLTPEDLVPELRLVIVLPPDPGAAELAASAPNTHFLAVGIAGLQPTQNLSLIGFQGARPDQAGFMAGVIAAIITPDWRVGIISTSDTAGGVAARQGFINGAIYFCGLCSPAYPPYIDYPLYAELPTSATPAEWQSAADLLLGQSVTTIYIYPEAGDAALRNYLAEKGVKLIGSEAPPDGLQAIWAASLLPDLLPAISGALPALLAGEGGIDLSAPLKIDAINPKLFSPGRQRLAEEILADLLAGYIATGAENP